MLEYLLYWGSENVFRYCQNNLYEIKTLREFQYVDDNSVDQGQNVRSKARDITNLLLNPSLLASKRSDGKQRSDEQDDIVNGGGERDDRRNRKQSVSAAAQRKPSQEDEDLQRAMQLSREEEERRRLALEDANRGGLFGDLEQ